MWIALNASSEVLYAVYYNYAIALNDAQDRPGAINAYRESIRLKPDFSPPYINLGRVLEDSGYAGDGVALWTELCQKLAIVNGDSVSHKLTALHQMARVLENTHCEQAAEDTLRQSLDIQPLQVEAMQHFIALRQRQCKWPAIEPWERVSRKDMLAGISSLSIALLADDPMFQFARAYHYGKTVVGHAKPVRGPHATAAGRRDRAKLRIGYVSSDFREHAVGFAMTDVMEQHNREHFEIFAYYCGINRTDPTQQRIIKAVDRWLDINPLNDDQAAARIVEDEIDVLVDLNGYTKDARTKVFARRPAPIAVNWFGFPGTMATPYHHYIIADATIIPPEYEIYYSEKVAAAAVLPAQRPQARGGGAAADPRRGRAAGKRFRLLLAQRHAKDHATRIPSLDDDPQSRARQRAVAAERHRGDQRTAAQGRRGAGGCTGAVDLRGEEVEPRPSRALPAHRPVPRQHALWRPHHRG